MDDDQSDQPDQRPIVGPKSARKYKSQCIDWFSKGEGVSVRVGRIQVDVRLVDRMGRRARIEVLAPEGAVFRLSKCPSRR